MRSRLLFFPMAAVALLAFVFNLLIDSDRDLTGRE
jgi:hypothetical protein